MTQRCKVGLVMAAWALASVGSAPALACGGGGVTSQVGVTMNSQRIFMSVRASGRTDVIAQITVPETTADYGVLIPVPAEPTLDSNPVSAEELDALDAATAPVISSQGYGSGDSGDSGCGCIGVGASGDDAAASQTIRGVSLSSEVTIGPVRAVSLTGTDADAVRAWLTDNGFSVPPNEATTLDRYVGEGRYFIAIRRAESSNSGGPSSVGIHYSLAGDHRMLSLGFTRIGAAPTLALTLFLAAPETVGPSEPFAALTLGDLDPVTLRANNYALAVESAVAARNSKAFVLENSTSSVALIARVPGLALFTDRGTVITRATTVVSREQISDDVVFATPFSGEVPSRRYVSRDVGSVRHASMGSLAFLLVTGALRRRRRARR